jgi:alpha-amylase/alpha-mannosidase (GH57 family)
MPAVPTLIMEKFICVHAHFYQPPRENPWLESVELQDSALPYHDWNERITAESYAPNATARILDGHGRIARIVSNYARISFNFGPTLLAWMKDKMPDVHDAIVAADRKSQENFSGHGSALAQVYNHMILPLGNRRDKYTQVFWGSRDFEHRFNRKPEGMWLSETAVDSETLEVLAELGLKFTILSPYQASRVREIGSRPWRDVNGARIDPTRPYLVRLRNGRSIAVFFYDAPVSQAVAFEGLLNSGERLAQRLMSAFSDRRNRDQLVHIATDGESYGHHHRYGEMALSYALETIENNKWARLTNYGEYLEKHPPTHEVQLHEKSSWSCSHGVGRWMTNCGCNTGRPGWHQNWRAPLRQALDWLRDQMIPLYESQAQALLRDPWDARNDYIFVILDRSPKNLEKFFARHATRELNETERVTVLKLMELQRHAMLMYTSCGWFFDELSGIETVQVIQYAGRAIQLAHEIFGQDFEPGFLNLLEQAPSNIPEHQNGRVIYNKFVKPAMIDWENVVAHYAISSVFENYSDKTKVFLYHIEEGQRHFAEAGKARLALGTVKVTFEITHEAWELSYAVLYMGEHNLTGGVRRFESPQAYENMVAELKSSFEAADFPQTIRLMDRHFAGSSYSLKSLFKDEQRRILNQILANTREDLESRYRLITERYTPLMKFLQDLGAPLPEALQTAADFILHVEICREFNSDQTDVQRLAALFDEARARKVDVFDPEMCYVVKGKMERLVAALANKPEDLEVLRALEDIGRLVRPLPLNLNLWKVQNIYYETMQSVLPWYQKKAAEGDEQAKEWMQHFSSFGRELNFAIDPVQT